jgi:type II secretory pathway component PulJ
MNHYEIMIALLIGALLLTVFLLNDAVKVSRHWQAMWVREAKELLTLKRYAVMRDKRTGRYVKKDKR